MQAAPAKRLRPGIPCWHLARLEEGLWEKGLQAEGAPMVFFTPELDGAMFGFSVMCYSNSVRRLRMMRRACAHTSRTAARGRRPLLMLHIGGGDAAQWAAHAVAANVCCRQGLHPLKRVLLCPQVRGSTPG